MQPSPISASCLFEVAIDEFLKLRRTRPIVLAHPAGYPQRRRRRRAASLSRNTERSYEQYAESLKLFFAGMPLEKIHCGNLAMYEEARLQGTEMFVRYRRPQDAKPRWVNGAELPPVGKTPCKAQPKKVNQELGLLRMLLRYAGVWTPQDEEAYIPLEEQESDVPRALTLEEQEHWLHTAARYEDTQVVLWYSLFNLESLNSTDEMRQYRVGDWSIHQRTAIVRRGKNRARERTVKIFGKDALWAMERLLERARECGAKDYHHYIFPARDRNGDWDPETPMSSSGLKRAWNLVRERSSAPPGEEGPNLRWVRQYDLRHTGITRRAEVGEPIASIMQQAGHVTEKMSRHYTHISEGARDYWAAEGERRRKWRRTDEEMRPARKPARPTWSPEYAAVGVAG